ncbi:hypothetical protein K439DRAFT_1634251 [Ramaria rubella]|nr:hypothetical protein K439DRAFT_1634251 [Ramaria rubella]
MNNLEAVADLEDNGWCNHAPSKSGLRFCLLVSCPQHFAVQKLSENPSPVHSPLLGSRTVMLLNDTIHGSIIDDEHVPDQFTLIADVQEWLPLLRQVYDSQQVVGFSELGAEVSHDRG